MSYTLASKILNFSFMYSQDLKRSQLAFPEVSEIFWNCLGLSEPPTMQKILLEQLYLDSFFYLGAINELFVNRVVMIQVRKSISLFSVFTNNLFLHYFPSK